jgi:hypothetical protein
MSASATARLDHRLLALTVLAAVTNDQPFDSGRQESTEGISLPATRRIPRPNAFRQARPEFVEFDDRPAPGVTENGHAAR